ncbi:MAG: DUF4340 domain-containing protein [Candidatus Aminicenantes bacterium]|nr:DUF4340 domain-containing protein [Candidatus Aminicenantes bacterium]
MKFRTTLILLIIFIGLLAFVIFFMPKKEKEGPAEKLTELPSSDVVRIVLKKEDGTFEFKKDDKGEWWIASPLEAKADNYEVNRLAEEIASLRIERIVEKEGKDPAKYEIPKKEISFWIKDKNEPIKILIGMENPLDNTLFAQKEGDLRIVLLSSYFRTMLDKKLIDFRQKDIFKFETSDVKAIKLKAKDIEWSAQKKEEEWFLEKPVNALAKKYRVEDVLNTLSNMRAKEFIVESKEASDLERYGLNKAEYVVGLNLPSKNQEIIFYLQKKDDKVYATTSTSTKIISVEDYVLNDLEKKVEDLREKQVASFYTWEANRVEIKKGELTIAASKEKDNKWQVTGERAEADSSKIESFIRKMESLEATEFIDQPGQLKDYGLDPPEIKVTIWVKGSDDKEKEYSYLIGRENPEKKQVIIKNPRLSYLFVVDSSFLTEIPKQAKDWLIQEEKKEEEKKAN